MISHLKWSSFKLHPGTSSGGQWKYSRNTYSLTGKGKYILYIFYTLLLLYLSMEFITDNHICAFVLLCQIWTAIHWGIYCCHPAKVWREQEHNRESSEQRGFRKSSFQTYSFTIKPVLMEPLLLFRTVAGECFFFITLKRLLHTMQELHCASRPIYTVFTI